MAKAKKSTNKRPDKYKEKVTIEEDFHGAMKQLANHANTKGTKKVTYKDRNSAKK